MIPMASRKPRATLEGSAEVKASVFSWPWRLAVPPHQGDTMTFNPRTLALVSTLLLASCGRGGGGGGGAAAVASGPQPVAINETNAKPVSARALDSVRDTSATQGATGV